MNSLDRFRKAQASPDSGFATALAEMRAGRKTSHWIWYIFPQFAVLGRSSTAQFYGLKDTAEASAYLRDPELGELLLTITEAAAAHMAQGISLETLMGGNTDALKLVSCMTLFRHLSKDDEGLAKLHQLSGEILTAAEAQGFPRCQQTIGHCRR